jgi:hypothetical protein
VEILQKSTVVQEVDDVFNGNSAWGWEVKLSMSHWNLNQLERLSWLDFKLAPVTINSRREFDSFSKKSLGTRRGQIFGKKRGLK